MLTNPSRTQRDKIISHHQKTLEDMLFKEQLGIIEQYQDNSTSPLFKKTFKSTTPNLDQLKSIKISELQFAKTNSTINPNKGKYLKGKLVQQAFKMTSIMTILEDETGTDVVQVAIYNYQLPKGTHVREEFKVGRTMIIKEPFYKIYVDGWPGIRVDNPFDIVFEETPEEKLVKEEKSILPKWQIVHPKFPMYKRAIHAGIVIEDKTLLYFGGVSPQKDMKLRSFSHRGELVLYDTQGGSSIIPKPSGDLPNAVLLD